MKVRTRGAIAAAVALSFIAAACGSDSKSSDATTAASQAVADTAAPRRQRPGPRLRPTLKLRRDRSCRRRHGWRVVPLTPVKLQLQWVTQAQFAGYYAAIDQGFYKAPAST